MANRTHQEINQNEIRPLELSINDHTGAPFNPSGAYATIYDSENNIVVDEHIVMISGEKIYTILDTVVTGIVGSYTVKWKILYGGYTYYHITDVDVVEL